MQGSSNCPGRGNQAYFAGSLGSVASHFIGYFDQDDVNLWRVFGLQDAEIAQEKRVRSSVGRAEILRERIAKPHMYATFDLSRASLRVDGMADVVSRNDALEPAIFAENDDLGGIAKGQVRRRVQHGGGGARLGREIADIFPAVVAADELR